MTMLYRFNVLMSGMLLSIGVYAGDFRIEDVWSRATAPGQEVASVDLTITSERQAKLIAVSSEVSKAGELHSMVEEGGMMRMRAVAAIDLPAGKLVKIGESGYHLMLVGLKAPLKAGERIPLLLTIELADERTEKITTMAKVKPLTFTKEATHEDEHKHHH